eukprot:5595989-Pleurochrysis_carterae.AAC.1
MVEGEHGDELAVRAHLHAPLPHLLQDVAIMPAQLRRRRPQRWAVDLSAAGEACVARRAPYRRAPLGVGA